MLAGSCIWSAVKKYQNGTAKVTKKVSNMGRSETQYVAMVTELLRSYWRAHLVESYCKVSNISDTNWLRYLFSNIWTKPGGRPVGILNLVMFIWILIYRCLHWSWKAPMGSGQLSIHTYNLFSCLTSKKLTHDIHNSCWGFAIGW